MKAFIAILKSHLTRVKSIWVRFLALFHREETIVETVAEVVRHPIVDLEHEFKTMHWTPEGYTHFTVDKKQ